ARVLGDGLVVALRRGFLHADRLPDVACDERVGVAGGATDAAAAGAARVTLEPLVGGRGAGRRPAAAGRGQHLADMCVAGDGRRCGVGDLVDDCGLRRVLREGLVVALRGGFLGANRLARVAAGEGVAGAGDAGRGAVVAGTVALQPEIAG